MIYFIIKNWKLVIDMLLVIGLVLVFAFMDPLNIFQHSQLKQTANLVTSVRGIGQLVTAEYYGEVISSWKELKLNESGKENIVFIGRGWVKAGFDFGKFDESNFLYDKDRKTIHFYGLNAVVKDHDINPWFIPQQKVKGFELVDFSGDVDFNDAKKVKADCKRKLLEQAGEELLRQAQENGREVLKNFFTLLLGEPDLIIEFHGNQNKQNLQPYDKDKLP